MHDEIMVEIEKSSAVEARAAAVMHSTGLPGGVGIGVSYAAGAASSSLDGLPGEIGGTVRLLRRAIQM
jgi:hypothetical protein